MDDQWVWIDDHTPLWERCKLKYQRRAQPGILDICVGTKQAWIPCCRVCYKMSNKERNEASTKDAVWNDDSNTPKWLVGDLRRTTLSMEAGEANFPSGSNLNCKGRIEDDVYCSSVQGNEYSWTALILQYVKRGQCRQALRMYDDMKKGGVEPSTYTFVALLKACSILQDLQSAKRIHAEVVRSRFESDVHVGSMLVYVYAKCRSLDDARGAFEKIPQRNVVSWNTMILGYAQMNEPKEALQLYSRMQQEGVVPDARTYVSALKACSSVLTGLRERNEGEATVVRKQKCLKVVKGIHADVRQGRFESDVFVGNILVDVYAKCGNLEEARHVFEEMCHRTVVSWNAMIFGYAQMDKGEEALALFDRMQQEGFGPNDRTYVSVLKACRSLAEDKSRGDEVRGNSRCLETVRAVHADVLKGGFGLNIFVGNMLVDVYAKCGSLQDARHVFERMPHRDVVSWNAMILGYAQMDQGEVALELYTRMRHDSQMLNDRTYVSVLRACSSLAEVDAASSGDNVAVKEKCLATVRAIHREIVKEKFESDVFVGTMLLDVYAKCGSLEDARSLFEKMPHRDVVSWNAMILGYVQKDENEVALHLYNRMQQGGVVPNEITYSGALCACGSVSGLEKGKDIHAQILKVGIETIGSSVIPNLINMYGKCGSMGDAQQVFDAMSTRDIVSWNALIAGYAHQGESELVFHWFRRMKEEGVQPDSSTLLSVLTACSHGGLVDLGQQYFEALSKDYGITPTIKHFTCVVDLLGRAGHVEKALEMVQRMPFDPDSAVLECVLGACRKWCTVEIARQAFEWAVRLDKTDAAAYVLMSNIYAAAHMQEERKQIQAMRVKSQAWKQPGQSRWTDLSGKVHVFVAGDREHPKSKEIYAEVAHLVVRMKNERYVPYFDLVLRDITYYGKVGDLCGHSEKMIMAYSLLQTPVS